MNFPNTALFMHSLTVDNKRLLNYLLRWIMLILIGLSLVQYLFSSLFSAQVTAPGLDFFQYITTLNLIFITVLGVTLFASVITEEKEVGSLNLLLMTGLTTFTLLLSKSTSKMIVGMLLILAQLPFSIMAVTLGGVSMRQIIAVYMVLFTYIFFISNLALFFSVITSKTYRAASWTFVVIAAFYILSLIFPLVAWISPFSLVFTILITGFKGNVVSLQIVIMWACSLSFFAISMYIFNYFTRISTNNGPLRVPLSSKKKLRLFPVPRTWKNAIAWKEYFFTSGGTFGIVVISCLLALVIGGGIYFSTLNGSPKFEDIGGIFLVTGGIVFGLQCVYLSSTIFNHELEEKTFSTLMMMPISLKEIAYSKILGGIVFAIPPIVAILIGLFFITDSLRSIPVSMQSLGPLTLILSGGIQFLFYLYLVTFFSLKIRYGGFVLAAIVFFIVQIGLGIPSMMIGMISAIPFGIIGASYGDIFAIIASIMTWGLYIFSIMFMHRLIAKRLKSLAGE